MDKSDLGVIALLVVIFIGGVVFGVITTEDDFARKQLWEKKEQENIITAFMDALDRENCRVTRLPIWQLKIENLVAHQTVFVNTDNIRAGNITFMSSKGVDSIKIPGGNYPYLDAVKAMRKAVQEGRGGNEQNEQEKSEVMKWKSMTEN